MGKCLVSRLSSVVANDNLPRLNTLVLDYRRFEAFVGIVVGASSAGDVIVKFSADVRRDNSTTGPIVPANTEYTVSAGTREFFAVPDAPASNEAFLTIKNTSNLESLMSRSLVFNNSQKSGNFHIPNIDGLVQLGGFFTQPFVLSSAKRIWIEYDEYDGVLDLSAYEGCQEILTNVAYTSQNGFPFVSAAPESLHVLQCRWKGSVANLPANLRYLRSSTGQSTGDLTDFVAKARLAGRTTGYLILIVPYNDNIKYNNESIVNNPNVPTVNFNGTSVTVLNWTENSVSFSNTIPSDAAKYADNSGASMMTWTPYE